MPDKLLTDFSENNNSTDNDTDNNPENDLTKFQASSEPKNLSTQELVAKAYKGLFPEKEFDYGVKLTYSGKFGDYNANVKYNYFKKYVDFKLSKKWVSVDDEIKIGLLQSLMQKIFKTKRETMNIDLYNKFLKNAHISAEKNQTDPILEESFKRVNENYFYGLIEKTNLGWNDSGRVLGKYEYGSDTITISKALAEDYELLDYVMYHEILHKKHKFESKKGRTTHHTTKFKEDEKAYPNSDMLEKRLNRVASKHRTMKRLTGKMPGFLPKKRRFRLKFW